MRSPRPPTAAMLAVLLAATLIRCTDGASGPAADTGADRADLAPDATGEVDVAPEGPCPFVNDGVCDEPASCPLGTDEADCDAACAADDDDPLLWGACGFRDSGIPDYETVPEELAALGSGGSGGLYGWWHGTIMAKSPDGQGQVRRYYLAYVPDSYDPARPAPLIFYLAGFGVSMYGNNEYTALNQLAERHGIIIVYAQQHFRNMGWLGWMMGWHVYLSAFAGGTWDANPDLDFLRRLTAHIKSLYNIDRTRVVVSGHSRGAGMSIILGYLAPDLFAGFCSQAGFVTVNSFGAYMKQYQGRHMPAVLVHGKLDDNVQPAESYAAWQIMSKMGWEEEDLIRYYPVPWVGHRWQPQLNQEWWDFMDANPLPLEEVRD